MALLSSGISQNVLHWPRMHQIKPYIKTICFAASIFVLDAVILNQGFVAVILILLALFVFFPLHSCYGGEIGASTSSAW
jgi:energy-coupling factor transporter transmembrane protein EcfT